MAFLVQQLINALALGSIYALMAIGLAIIFGILRLINFAHGELLMVGPYFVLVLTLAGIPFGPAVLLGVVASRVTGETDVRYAWDAALIPEEHRDWFGEQDGLLRSLRAALATGMERESILEIDAEARAEMNAAAEFADQSPWPEAATALEDVLAAQG